MARDNLAYAPTLRMHEGSNTPLLTLTLADPVSGQSVVLARNIRHADAGWLRNAIEGTLNMAINVQEGYRP